MKLIYNGKNMDVSDALREQTEKKLGKLQKYFKEEMIGKVSFENAKNRQIIEVTLDLPGTILRAEESEDNLHMAIDKAAEVLESQIRKYKTKLEKRYKNNETIRFENVEPLEVEEKGTLVKRKSFQLKPMTSEEAILQMELLRHNFFVYFDGETEMVNIVYKRRDGDYGLIEPTL